MTGKLNRISIETLKRIIEGIDKAWHAIHFILNESAWEGELPLFNVILGGTEIGEDMGFGPVRYVTNEEVKDIALKLSNLNENDLRNRFNPKVMNELQIYPAIDWVERGDQEFVFSYYEEVKNYYIDASLKNCAMLLYII
ncbi:YfbM family protein [Paenibacillus sp. SI8]|uniref:YfbM family protein n=1 Tax=unclassified Paenibacillus TaxID=185978 RepID=UPI00346510D6